MKKIKVFLVDDHDEVIQDHEYNVIKIIKDTGDFTTALVADYDGDFAVVKAMKDHSVNPYRYIVRRKLLIPILSNSDDE